MRSVSIGLGALTTPTEGAAIPLADRTKGTASLLVAAVVAPCTVRLEAAALADQAAWDVLETVTVAAPGLTEYALGEDVSVSAWHQFVRWNMTVGTSATLGGTFDLPFVDAIDDALLFSKELREFKDGLARLLEEAEIDVLGELYAPTPLSGLASACGPFTTLIEAGRYRLDPQTAELLAGAVTEPSLTIDLSQSGVGDDMRRAILAQAEHRFRRYKLSLSSEPSSIVTLRNLGEIAPGAMRALDKRRNRTLGVWRGR